MGMYVGGKGTQSRILDRSFEHFGPGTTSRFPKKEKAQGVLCVATRENKSDGVKVLICPDYVS